MRSRLSAFWTVLATVSGVIGTGVAIYSALQSEQHAAHLIFPTNLNKEGVAAAYVVALSEPVILTGRWYVRSGPWWYPQTLSAGTAVGKAVWTIDHYETEPLNDIRIPANERKLVDIDDNKLKAWLRQPVAYCATGDLEMGVEYKWKGGSSWARAVMPLCMGKN